MLVQALAVIINIALAPVLIAGWGTGLRARRCRCGPRKLDRGLDRRADAAVRISARSSAMSPSIPRNGGRSRTIWKRILNVGLPAGGEFAMMFIFMAVVYYVLRDFGAAAQAGFGIGQRVLGLIQMPALAIALAAGPIAGQNFGAGNGARVRETFVKAALIATVVMIGFLVLAQAEAGVGCSPDSRTTRRR